MRIAVVNEVSACAKNGDILAAIEASVPGAEILNLGMSDPEGRPQLTYMHTGLISAIILHAGWCDFVVGGCGTGQGYLNSVMQYPGIFCGLIQEPLDAWLFSQINGGNCVSLALNKGYGWAGDIELRYIIEKLFCDVPGQGYPLHRRDVQQVSRNLLITANHAAHRDFRDILPALDPAILGPVLGHAPFMECMEEYAQPGELKELILKMKS